MSERVCTTGRGGGVGAAAAFCGPPPGKAVAPLAALLFPCADQQNLALHLTVAVQLARQI